MNDAELLACLRLARTEQVGPVTYQRLIQIYGNATDALEALPELAARGGRRRKLKAMRVADARKELSTTEKHGGRYLVWNQPPYPPHLAALPDAPPILSAFGHVHLLERPSVAIVGARNASAVARHIAKILAEELGQRQYVVISGLARGVDGAAHHASLESGTIAVLGNGIEHFYPKENEELQKQIMAQGLILCENPPDMAPQAALFPRRNRIIAGLSLGTIVVEAARRSGSLITARLAADYGREVMAVPGSPMDARNHGSNNLIRDGAALVENVDHVLQLIAPLAERDRLETMTRPIPSNPAPPPDLSTDQRDEITALLSAAPVTIDALVQMSRADIPQVNLVLLELELAGRLIHEPGGLVSLIDSSS